MNVPKNEPVLVAAAVAAVGDVAVSFGVINSTTEASIVGAVGFLLPILLGFLARSKVTPVPKAQAAIVDALVQPHPMTKDVPASPAPADLGAPEPAPVASDPAAMQASVPEPAPVVEETPAPDPDPAPVAEPVVEVAPDPTPEPVPAPVSPAPEEVTAAVAAGVQVALAQLGVQPPA